MIPEETGVTVIWSKLVGVTVKDAGAVLPEYIAVTVHNPAFAEV